MTDIKHYYAPNGHPLLWYGEIPEGGIVTLENYWKWYRIYLIKKDGTVHDLDWWDYNIKEEFPMWTDHLVHPKLLERIAKHLGACVCPQSIEIAIGRWSLKKLEQYDKWSERTEDYD